MKNKGIAVISEKRASPSSPFSAIAFYGESNKQQSSRVKAVFGKTIKTQTESNTTEHLTCRCPCKRDLHDSIESAR